MPESIEFQIALLVRHLDTSHHPITRSELEARRAALPTNDANAASSRPWLLVAAALVPLMLLGGALIALLGNDGSSIIDDPSVTTQQPSTTTTTTLVPTTTVPADRVLPEPQTLTFSPVGPPSDEWPGTGHWVSNRFYLAFGDELYWTTDGATWRLDEDFADFQAPAPQRTRKQIRSASSDGARLAVLTVPSRPSGDGFDSYKCVEPEDVVTVIVRDADGVWSASQVPIPITDATPGSCLPVTQLDVTVGPRGMILTIGGYGGFGHDDDRERYPYLAEAPRIGIGWFSTDGAEWIELEPKPPFSDGYRREIVAGVEGFYAAEYFPAGSRDRELTYRSDDGLNWVLDAELPSIGVTHPGSGVEYDEFGWWNGQLVQNRADGVTLYEADEAILTDVDRSGRLFFGPSWIFGGGRGGFGDDIPAAEPMFFSPDGVIATTWTPAESPGSSYYITVLGVADEFVALYEGNAENPSESLLWIGELSTPG